MGKNENLVITCLFIRYHNQNKFLYKNIHWGGVNYLLKYLVKSTSSIQVLLKLFIKVPVILSVK